MGKTFLDTEIYMERTRLYSEISHRLICEITLPIAERNKLLDLISAYGEACYGCAIANRDGKVVIYDQCELDELIARREAEGHAIAAEREDAVAAVRAEWAEEAEQIFPLSKEELAHEKAQRERELEDAAGDILRDMQKDERGWR